MSVISRRMASFLKNANCRRLQQKLPPYPSQEQSLMSEDTMKSFLWCCEAFRISGSLNQGQSTALQRGSANPKTEQSLMLRSGDIFDELLNLNRVSCSKDRQTWLMPPHPP